MDELKNKNIKKIFLGIIIIGVIVGLAMCFIIAYNNTKESDSAKFLNHFAKTKMTKVKIGV